MSKQSKNVSKSKPKDWSIDLSVFGRPMTDLIVSIK